MVNSDPQPTAYVQAILRIASASEADYEEWRFMLDNMDVMELAEIYFLIEQRGCCLSEAVQRWSGTDVQVFCGTERQAAQELFDALYLDDVPEHLRSYIDYTSFGRDCRYEGAFREFMFCGELYTCTNSNHV